MGTAASCTAQLARTNSSLKEPASDVRAAAFSVTNIQLKETFGTNASPVEGLKTLEDSQLLEESMNTLQHKGESFVTIHKKLSQEEGIESIPKESSQKRSAENIKESLLQQDSVKDSQDDTLQADTSKLSLQNEQSENTEYSKCMKNIERSVKEAEEFASKHQNQCIQMLGEEMRRSQEEFAANIFKQKKKMRKARLYLTEERKADSLTILELEDKVKSVCEASISSHMFCPEDHSGGDDDIQDNNRHALIVELASKVSQQQEKIELLENIIEERDSKIRQLEFEITTLKAIEDYIPEPGHEDSDAFQPNETRLLSPMSTPRYVTKEHADRWPIENPSCILSPPSMSSPQTRDKMLTDLKQAKSYSLITIIDPSWTVQLASSQSY